MTSTAADGIPCHGGKGPREERFQGQSAPMKNRSLRVDKKLLGTFKRGPRPARPAPTVNLMMRSALPRLAQVPLAHLSFVATHDDLDIVQATPDELSAINIVYSL